MPKKKQVKKNYCIFKAVFIKLMFLISMKPNLKTHNKYKILSKKSQKRWL